MKKKGGFVKSTYSLFAKKKGIVLGVGIIILLIVAVIIVKRLNIFAETVTGQTCKYLISYDRDGGANPTYLKDNLNRIESMTNFPYNGITILLGQSVMTSTAKSVDTYKAALQPLKDMPNKPSKLTHNLVRVLLEDPGDMFDDTVWNTTAQNFANLAVAIKDLNDSGFKTDGILFDNEGPYGRGTCSVLDSTGDPIGKHGYWNLPVTSSELTEFSGHPDCWPYIRSWETQNATTYKSKAQARGTQVAQKIAATNTGINLMFMHSADTSCTNMNNIIDPISGTIGIKRNDVSAANEMLGPFVLGLGEGALGSSTKIVDGGEESYYFRSEPKFDFSYFVRNIGMVTNFKQYCPYIPDTYKSTPPTKSWSDLFDIGFAMYNKENTDYDNPSKDLWGGQTLDTIATSTQLALQHTNNYVWFYTEDVNSIDPNKSNFIDKANAAKTWTGGPWMSNIIQARNAVVNDPSCGTPTSPSPSSPSPSPSSPSPSPSIITSPSTIPSPSPTVCEPRPAPVLILTGTLSRRVDLSWTDSQNENGYSIRRNTTSDRGGAIEVYNSHTPNVLSWSDTTVSPNTTYWYWVAAYNGCGTGITYSSPVTVTTPIADKPAAPSNLIATGGSLRADISWSDNSANEDGFRLERKVSSTGTWANLITLPANTTSYRNNNLTAYTTYYYRVYAYNVAGNSAYSNEDPATAQPDSVAPSVPTNLRVVTTTTSTVNLAWNASTDDMGVVGYYIYRGGIKVGSTSGTTYADNSRTPGTTYSYQVSALDTSNNESGKSATVSATTQPLTDNPPSIAITSPSAGATVSGTTNINATATDDKGISKVDFYVDGIDLYSDTSAPFSYSWSTTRYTNASHIVRVRAYDTASQYADSSITVNVNNTTATITISNVRSTTTGTTATISWKTNIPTTSQVEYGKTPAYGYSSPLDLNLTTTHSIKITGLSLNTRYYVKVISTAGSSTKTTGSTFKTKRR